MIVPLLLMLLPTQADTVVTPLDTVRVGEARAVTRRATAQRDVAPTRATVPLRRLTAEDFLRRDGTDLSRMVSTLAGVGVKDYGGVGGLKTVNIRGIGSQHTLVLLDGLPMGDCQNGQADIGRIAPEAIASVRAEVAGTDDMMATARHTAAGATLVVETRAPWEVTTPRPVALDAVTSYGSFVTPSASIRCTTPLQPLASNELSPQSGGEAEGGFTSYLTYAHSNGDYPFRLINGDVVTHERREGSAVDRGAAGVDFGFRKTADHSLRVKADVAASRRGLPGSVIYYTQRPPSTLWDRSATATGDYRWRRGAWQTRLTASGIYQWNRYVAPRPATSAGPQPDDDERYAQQQATLGGVAGWSSGPWTLSAAAETAFAHLDENTPEAVHPTRLTTYGALRARWSTSVLTAQAALAGVTAAEWIDDSRSEFPPQSALDNADKEPKRSALLPSASLSWRLPLVPTLGEWRLRAAYKESYRLPTFNDLYYQRVGNRALLPERARQGDVGLTFLHTWGSQEKRDFPPVGETEGGLGFTSSLSVELDAYAARVRDKIVAIPTLWTWSMRNVAQADLWGAELTAAYTVTCGSALSIKVSGAYTWQHAEERRTALNTSYLLSLTSYLLPYTPRHAGNATVAVTMPWLTATYTLLATGERYSMAVDLPAYRLAPYADHSVALSRTFAIGSCRLSVCAEGLNLAGRNYDIVQYYPMAGRHYRLTIRFSN